MAEEFNFSNGFLDFKEKLNQKLAKNRESARNSRKRKKIYIELLETKVLDLVKLRFNSFEGVGAD